MRFTSTICLIAIALIEGATATIAAHGEGHYVDDRSTAESVVMSYYDAINRAAYARAFSYFGKNNAPDYDHWEFGYSDTSHVEVTFGETREEGAAGSIYYTLSVRLDVERTEGQHAWCVGCYQLRLAQPAIQGVPFEPLHSVSAELEDASEDAPVPNSCS